MQERKKGRPPKPPGKLRKGTTEYNRISSAISNAVVRFLNKNKHLRQKDFAELIGVNRLAITHYIKGNKIPDLMTFLRMVAIGVELNMKVGEFFVGEEKRREKEK